MQKKALGKVEFLGYVTDKQLSNLYAQAKGFLALSLDEDFGITPVESMLCGTPVIAFNGGGYKETVIAGKTGVFFDKPTVEDLISAIKNFEEQKFDKEYIVKHAEKFSQERFKKEIKSAVMKAVKK